MRDLAEDILDTKDILNQGNVTDKTPLLRKKLMESKTEIEKIGRIGEEMDGNASQSEEELFVEELSEQIPIVLGNIGSTLE